MKHQDLAVILIKIENAANAVEDVAKQILAAIKAADAQTLDAFDSMVSEAYRKNGWSQKAGRPSATATEKSAPDAVKLYVSTVRAAYRLKLNVMTFETIGALRQAIRDKRAEGVVPPPQQAPELAGVSVKGEHQMTGALWHDVLVLREHLPHASQMKFDEEVRKLVNRYIKAAPDFLKLVS